MLSTRLAITDGSAAALLAELISLLEEIIVGLTTFVVVVNSTVFCKDEEALACRESTVVPVMLEEGLVSDSPNNEVVTISVREIEGEKVYIQRYR